MSDPTTDELNRHFDALDRQDAEAARQAATPEDPAVARMNQRLDLLDRIDAGQANAPGFVTSIKQAGGQMLSATGRAAQDLPLIGGLSAFKGLRQWGDEIQERNPSAVNSVQDVLENPGMTLREGAGNAVGQMGPMAAGGVGLSALGGLIGSRFGLAGPGKAAGAWVGTRLPVWLQEYGGIRQEQDREVEAGHPEADDPMRAAAAAGAATAIEFGWGPQKLLTKAIGEGFEGTAKDLAGQFAKDTAGMSAKEVGRHVLKSGAKGILRQGLEEGGEELVQNPIEAWGAHQDPMGPESMEQAAVGAAKGFAGGVVLGGPVVAYQHSRAKSLLDSGQVGTEPAPAGEAQPGAGPAPETPPPSGPLGRAADAAQAVMPPAAPVDPLAERVAAIQPFVENRELLRQMRSDERFGPEAVSDALHAWTLAQNPNYDEIARGNALRKLESIFGAQSIAPAPSAPQAPAAPADPMAPSSELNADYPNTPDHLLSLNWHGQTPSAPKPSPFAKDEGMISSRWHGLTPPPAAPAGPAAFDADTGLNDRLGRAPADTDTSVIDRLEQSNPLMPSQDRQGGSGLDGRKASFDIIGNLVSTGFTRIDGDRLINPNTGESYPLSKASEKLKAQQLIRQAVDAGAHEAATSPLNDRREPTPANIEAGNWKRGPVNFQGMKLWIENPTGSTRRSKDPANPWETVMQHHYGEIRGTEGADFDPIDAFIGKNPASPKAFVIDQINPTTGKFDEHKVVLGTNSEDEARQTYLANYEPGWQGLGAITPMSVDGLKSWLKSGNTKEALALGKAAPAPEQLPPTLAAQPSAPAGVSDTTVPPVTEPRPGAAVPPAPAAAASGNEAADNLRRGTVGMKLGAGEVVLTQTGRPTTPFPKIDTESERKIGNTLKRVDGWLIENARAEAKARGDEFNGRQFDAMDLKNLSQSDKDSAEEYLFGDHVPPVIPPILKPLTPSTPATPNQTPATPTEGQGAAGKDAGKSDAKDDNDVTFRQGDVLKTESGRELAPLPDVHDRTETTRWLLREARTEAEATGNTELLTRLKAVNATTVTPEDRAAINRMMWGRDEGPRWAHVVSQKPAPKIPGPPPPSPYSKDNPHPNWDREKAIAKVAPEFRDRLRAVLAAHDAEGRWGQGNAVAAGINLSARPYTAENLAFHEQQLNTMRAQQAGIEGKAQPIAPQVFTDADLKADANGQMALYPLLPEPIRQAMVKRLNETAKTLADMGLRPGDVDTRFPKAAQDARQAHNNVWNFPDWLARQRLNKARGYKTFKPKNLENAEDAATEALGINTREHPGVTDPKTLGEIQPVAWDFWPDNEATHDNARLLALSLVTEFGESIEPAELRLEGWAGPEKEKGGIDRERAWKIRAGQGTLTLAKGEQKFTFSTFKIAEEVEAQRKAHAGLPTEDAEAKHPEVPDTPNTPETGKNGKVGETLPSPDDIVSTPLSAEDFADILDNEALKDELAFPKPEEPIKLAQRAKAEGAISLEAAKAKVEEWRRHALAQGKSRVNAGKVVLSLFDASGSWSQPWVDAGYDVYQFDLQNGYDVNDFNVEYLTDTLGLDDVHVVLAAPPCDHFANVGRQFWSQKDADGRTEQAKELVLQAIRTVELFRPAIWALENPIGRIEEVAGLPKPTLIFQPHHFGDPWTKYTRLWGDFETHLPLANVEPTQGDKTSKLSSSAKYERSLTPEGFAYAFFMANNLHDMGLAKALSREFRGLSRELFQEALDAGVSEYDIRSAIVDSYYEHDLKGAEDELRAVMQAKAAPAAKTEPAPAPTQADATPAKATIFVSGLSRPGDFTTALEAGKPAGIEIGELSNPGLQKMAQLLANKGGTVFVDSGAFSIFMANLAEQKKKGRFNEHATFTLGDETYSGNALDFGRIFDRYSELVGAVQSAAEARGRDDFDDPNNVRMYLVMPDIVGNQDESIALIATHAKTIREWHGYRSVLPIIPIQKGEVTLAQAYDAIKKLVGEDFIIGIPSNKEAVTDEELAQFLEERGKDIRGIHILGAAASSRLDPKLALIQKHAPGVPITADASPSWTSPRAEALQKALEKAGERDIPPEGAAPAVPEPKGWRTSYGTARKYAEALGVPLKGKDGKFLKLAPLVGAIDAHLAKANATTPPEAAPAAEAPTPAPAEPDAPPPAAKPLSDITVTVHAQDEDGNPIEFEEKADAALKDVDDRLQLARRLLECLAS